MIKSTNFYSKFSNLCGIISEDFKAVWWLVVLKEDAMNTSLIDRNYEKKNVKNILNKHLFYVWSYFAQMTCINIKTK